MNKDPFDEFNFASFTSPKMKSSDVKNIKLTRSNDVFEVCTISKNGTKIESLPKTEISEIVSTCLTKFKQCLLKNNDSEYQILINKKNQTKIVNQKSLIKNTKPHNKHKNYLIPDGIPCDFLIEIGIMDSDGKVKPTGYKKFRQINRFLEMVDDLFKNESKDFYHIADFGCGKSYLTFAIYFYFNKIRKIPVKITGVDIKENVINDCNAISKKLKYKNLSFVHGFIHDFKTDEPVDFVVTLHACDTATDDAILFSIDHSADKMMFVPCCQHELNKQLKNSESEIMLGHGIFRDRMNALVTDTMRTQLLESVGYKVQSMEFIDLEHTAKNILLRCTKSNNNQNKFAKKHEDYLSFKKQWGIEPYLEKELKKRFSYL